MMVETIHPGSPAHHRRSKGYKMIGLQLPGCQIIAKQLSCCPSKPMPGYPALYLVALVLSALSHPGNQGSPDKLVMGQEWPIDINAPPIPYAVLLGVDDFGEDWII